MTKKINVLFVPWAKKNPYQTNLAEALLRVGARVVNQSEGYDEILETLVAGDFSNEEKPDIIHLHWTHPYTNPHKRLESLVLGFRLIRRITALKSLGIKIVWTIHNLKSHESVYPRMELFFLGRLAKSADALIVHCDTSRQIVSQKYRLKQETKNNIFVTPHANYIGCYNNNMNRSEARKRLGFGGTDRIFLFFGQVRAYKGIGHLIKDFKSLNDPSSRLIIVGKPKSPDVLKTLEKLKRGDARIIFHSNFIPDDEIQMYMNASDAVVLPFTDILTSGSALLAMSFKKPIIAPRIGCIPELLVGQDHILYNPDDKDGLSNALQSVSRMDIGTLKALGKQNYSHIKNLTWTQMAKSTYQVYNRITRAADHE